MSTLKIHTIETAPQESKSSLEESIKNLVCYLIYMEF